MNVVVAVLAMAIARATPYREASPGVGDGRSRPAGSGVVYVAIALSGMTALAAEVIWTRILSLLFGATTYTFSLILAAFLVGLGIGSTIGSSLARSLARPRVAFAWCQLLLCAAIAWSAHVLTQSLPYWPINPSISSDPWFTLQLDLVRCLWAVLPAAILWGASFPLALASVAARGQDPARLVGGVYAANTVGAIVGALERQPRCSWRGSAASTRSRCSSSSAWWPGCWCSSRSVAESSGEEAKAVRSQIPGMVLVAVMIAAWARC